jgi:hypothetical protein
MDGGTEAQITESKDLLRSAILFANWNDARRALELLEEIEGNVATLSAFTAARGGCEFCPADGGPCCICGHWN